MELQTILLAATPSDLLAARNQMALSLGWHIILACFGVAFPALIFALHRYGLRRNDDVALELAKRWSKVAAVLFAIGAVSGTILSFELGLLWPGLMETYGDVVGLAFALEGIAFFTEAIFIGIYLYGWNRIPGNIHSLMLIPIIISGTAGTFFVISVNAWMNAPSGFDMINGEVANIDPIAAIFNPAVTLQFLHMWLAAYMVAGFGVASVYALGILRGRDDRLHRLGVTVALLFGGAAALIQPFVGHLAGQNIADRQPIKLAAIEGLGETESGVDLVLGGFYQDGEVTGGIPIPVNGLASFLATNSFDGEIVGLNSVPEAEQPPINIVRTSFQIMVAIGTLLAGVAAWFGHTMFWKRRIPSSKWFLRLLVPSGVLAAIALEAGWVTTEVGRQPWVVHQELLTKDAVTDSGWIWLSLSILVVVYAGLTAAAVAVIRSMSARWRSGEKDLRSPYGPPRLLSEERSEERSPA